MLRTDPFAVIKLDRHSNTKKMIRSGFFVGISSPGVMNGDVPAKWAIAVW